MSDTGGRCRSVQPPSAAGMAVVDVLGVIDRLQHAGIEVWLDGGWGVDALLGTQTRAHDDLDVVLPLAAFDRAVEALSVLDYTLALDGRPTRAVLAAPDGRSIDLHPVTFDGDGTGWQQGAGADGRDFAHPADDLVCGTVGGRSVGCLSARWQLRAHEGYTPDDVDHHDVDRLRALLEGRHGGRRAGGL